MKRPADLRMIPLAAALPNGRARVLAITMGPGQWDPMLAAAYADGWVLLEIGPDEKPARAYQKPVDRAEIADS